MNGKPSRRVVLLVIVAALYPAILGRDPDADGRDHWIGQVQQRGTASVAADFYQSIESPPDAGHRPLADPAAAFTRPGGRDYWAGR